MQLFGIQNQFPVMSESAFYVVFVGYFTHDQICNARFVTIMNY